MVNIQMIWNAHRHFIINRLCIKCEARYGTIQLIQLRELIEDRFRVFHGTYT